jgi:orotate phosphoribosyltransferase
MNQGNNSGEWEELRQLLLEKSYQERQVILASGQESNFYVDCRQTTLHGRGAQLIGKLFFAHIRRSGALAVGGPTLGADPIVTAVSLTASLEGVDFPAFIVRKAEKAHGLQNRIEGMGNLPEGTPVAIVEDVVTTASSTFQAIDSAEAAGLKVVKVMCLVDREEGGRENLAKRGFKLDALYTKTTLLEGIPEGS